MNFLRFMILPAVIFAAGCSGVDKVNNSHDGVYPNIVFIVVDDLGWRDLGCYGSSFYETPNIDSLAAEGIRFTNAYSACPVCSPTRASLMTGKDTARVHMTGHITAIGRHRHPEGSRIIPPKDNMFLSLDEVTVAEVLERLDYSSISIGKWHLGPEKYWPTKQGFDRNIAGWTHGSPPCYFYPYKNPESSWNPGIPTLHGGEPGEYLTDRLTDEALSFIDENQKGPFFLYLPYYAVHTPLQAPENLIEKYRRKLKKDSSQKNAVYGAMVERTDTNIGRILERLDSLGLRDNTLVIAASDNGGESRATNNAPLREGKGHIYEGGIRVPLVMRWEGLINPGTVSDVPVTTEDFFPTVAEAAGAAYSKEGLDGTSLIPLFMGKDIERECLYWYYPHYSPQAKEPASAVRVGDYKLIKFYDPPRVELYNLEEDISEQEDLSEKMPAKTEQLLGLLEKKLEEAGTVMHTLNPGYEAE